MRIAETLLRTPRGQGAAASSGRRACTVQSWALLSTALSHENRVLAGRPEVDAVVQLAAEIALSEPRKFRYNRGD